MTELQRTWTVALNNVPTQTTVLAQGRAIQRARLATYLAAGWTVQGSSDGATAGMDGVNRWDSDTDLNWESGGNARSWFVIRSPAGFCNGGNFLYCLVALSTGAANPHLVNITWSTVAFAGTLTTADPTTTGANARAFTNKQYIRAALANSRYHTARSNAGDVLFLVSADGSGYFMSSNLAANTLNQEPGDNYPVFAFEGFSDTGRGAFTIANSNSTSHAAMWGTDGLVIATSFGLVDLTLSGTALMGVLAGNGLSTISGQAPWVPAILASSAASYQGFRGNLPDIALAPRVAGFPVGTEEPNSPEPSTTMVCAEVWVPCGNQTPSL